MKRLVSLLGCFLTNIMFFVQVLEDAMKIIHVMQPCGESKRRRGVFLALVPMSVYEADHPNRKYGIEWLITFANQELATAMEAFLQKQETQWANLSLWVREKLKVEEMTFKELMSGMGHKDGKPIKRTSFLRSALNKMIENNEIIKVMSLRGEEEYKLA